MAQIGYKFLSAFYVTEVAHMRKAVVVLMLASFAALYMVSPLLADASPAPTSKTIEREIKMGKKISEQVEKEMPRVLDPAEEARLGMIAGKLTPYLERDLEYKVRIVDMKEPNAFSLPGGMTYITTGMLDFLKSDSEIAAVLAHEFIHADRAHVIVQAARNNRLNIMTIAGIIAATQGGGAGAMIMTGAMQTAIMNAYSIDLEKEADARGIDVLTKAGYNPAAMLTMMERLKIEQLQRAYVDPGIFQTHPEVEERVDAALKYMKDNGIEVQRKEVLQSLKIDVDNVSDDVRITVDGAVLLSHPKDPEADKLFRELKTRLDETLELELAPYDIQVMGAGEKQLLMIKGRVILSAGELLAGMPALAEIRGRINDALIKARKGNLLTDYFK